MSGEITLTPGLLGVALGARTPSLARELHDVIAHSVELRVEGVGAAQHLRSTEAGFRQR